MPPAGVEFVILWASANSRSQNTVVLGRMAESRDEGEALRESIREMVSHCEAMQDGAKALEVGGAMPCYILVGAKFDVGLE